MNRILATLLTFIILIVTHGNVAMAFTMEMSNPDHMHHGTMHMGEMNDKDCCDSVKSPSDCEKNNHECCFVPVPTTTIPTYVNSQKQEKKDFSTQAAYNSFIKFVFEDFSQDQYKSDSSPPWSLAYTKNSSYISLTGIIKNIN